ncbi:class I SAM-dependent methyltransferase [Dactylosporangium sp. NBC_01737]|uniref:class I SAM-dependent methyltransferase n=1 Tax=Dactylosporangium sp. NBC_01737 TaxID=2975959 RepID=UPI002E0FEA51|nr:class I SAM-dependent methyltransferase [Dactylosporangium sp. NBC_01737]
MSGWDAHAATFDDEADHGLRDPVVRDAWAALLTPALPAAPAAVLDVGCGTGSLSVLLAGAGHRVCGLDASPRMLDVARGKADRHGVTVPLVLGDAARPPFAAASFDVVLARHVLWALPDPAAVLARWVALLRPHGRLVLIEGRWSTGAGITARDCVSLVRRHRQEADLVPLRDDALWGRAVTDERYLLLSRR